jgi:hypothetical protein
LKTNSDAFDHASRHPGKMVIEKVFLTSAVIKNKFTCICAFCQVTDVNHKNVIIEVWSDQKKVLMHLRILLGPLTNGPERFVITASIVKNKF